METERRRMNEPLEWDGIMCVKERSTVAAVEGGRVSLKDTVTPRGQSQISYLLFIRQ